MLGNLSLNCKIMSLDKLLKNADFNDPNSPSTLEDEITKEQKILEKILKTPRTVNKPTPEKFEDDVNNFFKTIPVGLQGKHVLHAFLGLAESDVKDYIKSDMLLGPIYDYAMERICAKAEVMLHKAGRASDTFAMKNYGNWLSKDKENNETKRNLTLGELHNQIKAYKKRTA